MAKHNKKRNVGLLYEQLMKFVCNSIIENNTAAAKKAIDIICSHFKPGTALYKEFRLFNALVNSAVEDRVIARRIIEESKSASKSHDKNELRREKSRLIKEINHSLDNPAIYNQKLETYRTLATVQALLNEWRGAGSLAPDEIVKYEKVLEDWLVRQTSSASSIKKEHANPLTLNVMINKFKKKYEGKMNREQHELFESFLFGRPDIEGRILKIKSRAKKVVKEYFRDCDNEVLNEKSSTVMKQVDSLCAVESMDAVAKALVVSSLAEEMEA